MLRVITFDINCDGMEDEKDEEFTPTYWVVGSRTSTGCSKQLEGLLPLPLLLVLKAGQHVLGDDLCRVFEFYFLRWGCGFSLLPGGFRLFKGGIFCRGKFVSNINFVFLSGYLGGFKDWVSFFVFEEFRFCRGRGRAGQGGGGFHFSPCSSLSSPPPRKQKNIRELSKLAITDSKDSIDKSGYYQR